MPLSPLLRRVARWSTGTSKVALGSTLGDLRLEAAGRRELTPVDPTATSDDRASRRARIREEVRRERAEAARRAAEQ